MTTDPQSPDQAAVASGRSRLRRRIQGSWFGGILALLYAYNFPYFDAIHSANELPRIYLTMAMVDRQAFNIDPEMSRLQPTPDTSTYKGKLYSNKAPGMSFLTIPVYAAQKAASGGKTPELRRMFFWFRLFGATVPSLLFLWLLSRFLRDLVPSLWPRRLVLAAYALGTMAMTYGTLLIAHQLSSLLMATGFVLAFWIGRGKGRSLTSLWAGLAAGSAVLVDYQTAFLGPPLFLYLVWRARPRWLREGMGFALGAAVPLAGLLLYHWGCFEHPLRTGYHYPTNPVFAEWHSQGFLGLKAFRLTELVNRYFSADDGLFYYSPFLLLAFPGLALMFRRRELRAEAVFCAVAILIFVLFISSVMFVSGWDVGPRYITCALPYYLVPVAVVVAALEGRAWYLRAIPYGLMALGIAIYVPVSAVFPHFPDNFSNPVFDVAWRFGGAGYWPYSLGWLLGLEGLGSAIPYLGSAVGLVLLLLWRSEPGPRARRLALTAGALAVVVVVLGAYWGMLAYRRQPVPERFLGWMEQIYEPRHAGMSLAKITRRIGPAPRSPR
ncbi:MAG: hypothetical protein IT371_03015 [Deltaproteobacteria bacterium]|nr:hypothetical protein [Deltaproteobacteria bacterium]